MYWILGNFTQVDFKCKKGETLYLYLYLVIFNVLVPTYSVNVLGRTLPGTHPQNSFSRLKSRVHHLRESQSTITRWLWSCPARSDWFLPFCLQTIQKYHILCLFSGRNQPKLCSIRIKCNLGLHRLYSYYNDNYFQMPFWINCSPIFIYRFCHPLKSIK